MWEEGRRASCLRKELVVRFVVREEDRSVDPLFGGLAVEHCILVGCDLHDKSMLLKHAVGSGEVKKRSFGNNRASHEELIRWLRRVSAEAGSAKVYFAYEASGLGFVLHDRLTAAGFTCYVLAPTKMKRSAKSRTTKCDERDAEAVLRELRSHVPLGERLPAVTVPDAVSRDDRELTRGRQAVADKLAAATAARLGPTAAWCPHSRRAARRPTARATSPTKARRGSDACCARRRTCGSASTRRLGRRMSGCSPGTPRSGRRSRSWP